MCGVVIFTKFFFLLVLFFRSSLYKALDGELPDLAMLRVSEVYKDFPPSLAPLVTTMGMSADVPLVQSAFGAVQAGSVQSFQHKPPAMREVINIPSAPASPTLPIHSYRLEPPSCAYVLSEQEHLHRISYRSFCSNQMALGIVSFNKFNQFQSVWAVVA